MRKTIILVAIGIVLIGIGVGAVLAYQSYQRNEDEQAAQDAWLVYWNAAVDAHNRYVDDYNAVQAQSDDEPRSGEYDTVVDAMRRFVKAMSAIEPPAELAAIHAEVVKKWKKEARALQKQADRMGTLLAEAQGIDSFDIVAMQAAVDGIEKAADACVRCDERADAVWDKWAAAVELRGEELGYTFSP